MAEREAGVPEDRRIRLRIGINLGDVIREADGDLYGDGVNIAARLEQLAEPGGVVVSGTAYDQLHGKLDLTLDFAGEQRVKNIERLVRAYRFRLDGTAAWFRLPFRGARRFARPAVAALLPPLPSPASPQRGERATPRDVAEGAEALDRRHPERVVAQPRRVTAARSRRSRSRPRFQRRAAPLPGPRSGFEKGA